MISPTTRRLAITATVTVALLLTGCSTTPAEPDAPAGTAARFGHVHGIVDAGDSTVLLGTRSFKGNVLDKHLSLQDVTPAHFAAWVHLWNGHTARLFAPEVAHGLQAAAHGVARNLFRGYFGSLPAFAASGPQHPHARDH